MWLGRTYADAPDVDGNTWVRGAHFKPGDLVECEIVGAEEHDLIARPVVDIAARRSARPGLGPGASRSRRWRSSMACRRSHSAGMPTFAALSASLSSQRVGFLS